MKDGYYLSTYIHIDELAHYYKLKIRHDQNIALWKYVKGKLRLIRYWELERITRFKHHAYSFKSKEDFQLFLSGLLKEFELQLSDIEEVWDKREEINSQMDWYGQIAYHNLAHIFSALLNDTNSFRRDNILVIAVDGGPDSIGLGKDDVNFSGVYSSLGEIKGFTQLSSPGPLWSWAKKLFSLEEGSLMALMSASKSKLINYTTDNNIDIIDFNSAMSSYYIIKRIYDYVWALTIEEKGKKYNFFDDRFSRAENNISMVMKVVFELSCNIMFRNIERMIEEYNIIPKNTMISIVGGYGLNCPSNTILMRKYGFKKFIEVPCANDSGISLGIGLLEAYRRDKNIIFNFENAYYGTKVDWHNNKEINDNPFVKSIEYNCDKEIIYNDLQNGPIIWISGEMEIGPRALGHRSLLALTRKEDKIRLNEIKQRQWWRPVAPIVDLNKMNTWLVGNEESSYMLKTYSVRREWQKVVPAICHLDNSARVQTISENDDKDLYELLCVIGEKTGVSILCNTSLNDIGEPIINSVNRGIEFAIEKGIGIMYVDGNRIELNSANKNISKSKIGDPKFWQGESEKKKKELNPHDLNANELIFFINTNLLHNFDIKRGRDARILKKMYAYKLGNILQDIVGNSKK